MKSTTVKNLIVLVLCSAIILFVSGSYSEAASYYVDSMNGNDNNTGLEQTSAWKTINKVNSINISPGDSVLFKRGGIWREQLTVSSSGNSSGFITFSAYGMGNNPIIMGSNSIKGWVENNSKWTKDFSKRPRGVWFINKTGDIIWGAKRKSLDELINEYDWYWNSGILYIVIDGNPDEKFKSVEVSDREYCIGFNSGTRDNICVSEFELLFAWRRGVVAGWDKTRQSKNWIIEKNIIHHIGDRIAELGDGIAYYALNATIRNNTIYEIGSHGVYLISYKSPCRNNVVEYNEIYNSYHTGIDVMGYGGLLDNTTLRYNTIYNTDDFTKEGLNGRSTGMNGIYTSGVESPVINVKIYNNLVFNTLSGGIHIGKKSYNINIHNNTVYKTRHSWSSPIYTTTEGPVTIKNNIGVNGKSGALKIYGSLENKTIDYNCWYQEQGSVIVFAGKDYANWEIYKNETKFDTHSINKNPLFINPTVDLTSYDFQIQSNSPCKDNGTNTGLSRDYDGTPVPQGNGYDIGAYERKK
ncbi:right-handed parallel beta-helix repeat-containing protein [candidate division KSB1 bacterium]